MHNFLKKILLFDNLYYGNRGLITIYDYHLLIKKTVIAFNINTGKVNQLRFNL